MRRVASVADSRAPQSRRPRGPPPSSAATSRPRPPRAHRSNTCGRWRSAAYSRSGPRPAWRSLLGGFEQRKDDADAFLLVALASGLGAADDLADLGVDVIACEPSTLDQRMERAAVPALRPVVDHELV